MASSPFVRNRKFSGKPATGDFTGSLVAVRQEFARRRYGLTDVRILDLLILSVTAAARRAGA